MRELFLSFGTPIKLGEYSGPSVTEGVSTLAREIREERIGKPLVFLNPIIQKNNINIRHAYVIGDDVETVSLEALRSEANFITIYTSNIDEVRTKLKNTIGSNVRSGSSGSSYIMSTISTKVYLDPMMACAYVVDASNGKAFMIFTRPSLLDMSAKRNLNGLKEVDIIKDLETQMAISFILADFRHHFLSNNNSFIQDELTVLNVFASEAYKIYGSTQTRQWFNTLFSSEKYMVYNTEHGEEVLKNAMSSSILDNLTMEINKSENKLNKLYKEAIEQERKLTRFRREKICFDPTNVIDNAKYLANHPYLLKVIKAPRGNNSSLRFEVRVPFSQFDPDIYAAVITNYLRNNIGDPQTKSDMRLLLDSLIVDQKGKLFFFSSFDIDPVNKLFAFNSLSGSVNQKLLQVNAIKQPHTGYNFSCVGSYNVQIQKALDNNDLVGTFESLLGACKNWNIADSTVSNSFIGNIQSTDYFGNIKCIEYDNQLYTMKEYINKIKEEKSVTSSSEVSVAEAEAFVDALLEV